MFCHDATCGLLFQDYLYYVINDHMFVLSNINYNLYNNSWSVFSFNLFALDLINRNISDKTEPMPTSTKHASALILWGDCTVYCVCHWVQCYSSPYFHALIRTQIFKCKTDLFHKLVYNRQNCSNNQ